MLDSTDRGGRSSVGRAPGCGPGGRGFESHRSPSQEVAANDQFLVCVQRIGADCPSGPFYQPSTKLGERRSGRSPTGGDLALTLRSAPREAISLGSPCCSHSSGMRWYSRATPPTRPAWTPDPATARMAVAGSGVSPLQATLANRPAPRLAAASARPPAGRGSSGGRASARRHRHRDSRPRPIRRGTIARMTSVTMGEPLVRLDIGAELSRRLAWLDLLTRRSSAMLDTPPAS
jgi:hypothetical protein